MSDARPNAIEAEWYIPLRGSFGVLGGPRLLVIARYVLKARGINSYADSHQIEISYPEEWTGVMTPAVATQLGQCLEYAEEWLEEMRKVNEPITVGQNEVVGSSADGDHEAAGTAESSPSMADGNGEDARVD